MNLSDYLSSGRGIQSALCNAIGAHSPDMTRWASGQRPVPPERCLAIERFTDGQVAVEQMRPDLRWIRVPDPNWPNAKGRPCIDVIGPAACPAPQG